MRFNFTTENNEMVELHLVNGLEGGLESQVEIVVSLNGEGIGRIYTAYDIESNDIDYEELKDELSKLIDLSEEDMEEMSSKMEEAVKEWNAESLESLAASAEEQEHIEPPHIIEGDDITEQDQ